MNLIELLLQKLRHTPIDKLAKDLSYTNTKNLSRALELLAKQKDLYSWLYHSGFYDFRYSAKEFIIELCKVLIIDEDLVQEEIDKQYAIHVERDKLKKCSLFINTDPEQKGPSSFMMALAYGTRYLSLPVDDLLFKTPEQALLVISNVVQAHYKMASGTHRGWGKIHDYTYLHSDGVKYTLDPWGHWLPDGDGDPDRDETTV